jgi:hypothetical protein
LNKFQTLRKVLKFKSEKNSNFEEIEKSFEI